MTRWSLAALAGLAFVTAACAGGTTTQAALRHPTTTSSQPTTTTTTATTTTARATTTTAAASTTTAPATTTTTTTAQATTSTTEPAATSTSTEATTTTVPATTTTMPVFSGPPANGLAGVLHVGGIPSNGLIRPTAVILHWWGAVSNSDIYSLIGALNSEVGYYEPWLTKAQFLYDQANGVNGHHLGVQFAVTQDGKMWELTPYANSYAAHAACGNGWAVGIEIEGRGAADLHADVVQFRSVVRLVGELLAMFHIDLAGAVAANGLSGSGVLSHKEVDAHCYFADGSFAGTGKIDVDDAYLADVKAALAAQGFH